MLHMDQWRIDASHKRCANGAVSGGVCITPNIRWQLHCASGDVAPYYRPSPISPTHYGMHQLPPPRNLDETNSTEGTEREGVRHVPILAV